MELLLVLVLKLQLLHMHLSYRRELAFLVVVSLQNCCVLAAGVKVLAAASLEL